MCPTNNLPTFREKRKMPGHRANRSPRGLCQATLAEAAKGFPHKCPMGQDASSASNLRKHAALEILALESSMCFFLN